MPKRTKIIALCALLIAAIGLVLSVFVSEQEQDYETAYTPSESNKAISESSTEAEAVEKTDEISASEAAALKAARYKQLRAEENTDISFFGKVIDTTGKGIVGCRVVFQVSGYEASENLTDDETFEVSDIISTNADGSFVIDGFKGRSLRILEIKKAGYTLEQVGRFSFTYGTRFGGRHIPEASNPVLFEMVELDGSAKLLSINERVDVPAGQDEITLPLRLVSSDEGLKLKISFDRSENPQSSGYDWSYSVKLINGTLQEADDGTLLEAPQGGYINELTQEYDASSTSWTMRSQKLIYLKPENPSAHAGIKLTVFSYKDGRSRVIVNGSFNPDGRIVVTYR
jgi:hypothetical protein